MRRSGGEIFHSSRTTPRESEIKLSVRRTFDSNEKFSALPSAARVHHYLHLRYLNLAATISPVASSCSIGIAAKSAITSISRRYYSGVYTIVLHIRITQFCVHAVNAAP